MGSPVTEIAGIGPAKANIVEKHGFGTAESIASSSISALTAVPGFGPIRAKKFAAVAKKSDSTSGKVKLKKKKKASPKSKFKAKGSRKNKAKFSRKNDEKSSKKDGKLPSPKRVPKKFLRKRKSSKRNVFASFGVRSDDTVSSCSPATSVLLIALRQGGREEIEGLITTRLSPCFLT